MLQLDPYFPSFASEELVWYLHLTQRGQEQSLKKKKDLFELLNWYGLSLSGDDQVSNSPANLGDGNLHAVVLAAECSQKRLSN